MKEKLFKDILTIIRRAFHTDDFIPLHVPGFTGNEKKYLADCIDSGYVSSVGQYVNEFEEMFKTYVGSGFAVAAVNGTAALQVALRLVGVERDDEVLTQALSFVGTANAISYCCAQPVFLDVERSTLGMDPEKLEEYLRRHTFRGDNGYRYNKNTKKRIAACVPVHIFGHPCRVDAVAEVCAAYGIPVVEDAAESIGSQYKGKHTGRFGRIGIFSFNGNKTMTTGGGGMLVTDDKELALRAKHITTTAKVPHPWEYVHDEVGYNFRMPNINAALGCAQLEQLDAYLKNKRQLAEFYRESFKDLPFTY
ncbi:MAG: LegC family aminotransferase, partial [Spirochaetia bacterium]